MWCSGGSDESGGGDAGGGDTGPPPGKRRRKLLDHEGAYYGGSYGGSSYYGGSYGGSSGPGYYGGSSGPGYYGGSSGPGYYGGGSYGGGSYAAGPTAGTRLDRGDPAHQPSLRCWAGDPFPTSSTRAPPRRCSSARSPRPAQPARRSSCSSRTSTRWRMSTGTRFGSRNEDIRSSLNGPSSDYDMGATGWADNADIALEYDLAQDTENYAAAEQGPLPRFTARRPGTPTTERGDDGVSVRCFPQRGGAVRAGRLPTISPW